MADFIQNNKSEILRGYIIFKIKTAQQIYSKSFILAYVRHQMQIGNCNLEILLLRHYKMSNNNKGTKIE